MKLFWFLVSLFVFPPCLIGQPSAQVDSLLNLLESDLSEKQNADTYINLAKLYVSVDTLQMMSYVNHALKICGRVNYIEGKVNGLILQGMVARDVSDHKRASSHFELAYNLAEKANYLTGMAMALNHQGLVLWDKASYDEAMKKYQQSLTFLEKSGSPQDLTLVYNSIAMVHHVKGELEVALNYYQKCLQSTGGLGADNIKTKAMSNIGVMHLNRGEYDEALSYYFRALEVQKRLSLINNIGFVYNNIGVVYKSKGDYDQALKYYALSTQINEDLGLKGRALQNYINVGAIHFDRGQYDSASLYYNKSLSMSKVIGDRQNMILAYRNLGLSDFVRGKYNEALDYYFDALKLARTINSKYEEGAILNNIGEVYQQLEINEKALSYYDNSLLIKGETGDQLGIAESYSNIGLIYQGQERYDLALQVLENGLRINLEIGDEFGVTGSYLDLAAVNILMSQYVEAREHCKKALLASQKMDLPRFRGLALVYFGEIEIHENRLNKALEYLTQGLSILNEIGDLHNVQYGSSLLIRAYAAQGKYEQAFNLQAELTLLSDSLYNNERIEKFIRQEADFEFQIEKEKIQFVNDKEKLALDQKINDQKTIQYIIALVLIVVLIFSLSLYRLYKAKASANLALKDLNQEKNKIMGVVAHDLRSPLNNIKGLINLFKMETNDQEMPQMNYLDLALTCTNRLSDMIGRLLDVRALESQKIELRLEAIDARNVIDRLIQNYAAISVDKQQTISKNYTYENPIIEVDENFLIQVLDNLISNALKFAKQNTEVKILVSGNDSDVLITVKDQGPGISEEDQSKLFGEFVKLSATPTGKEKSTGLGLSIVKKYVELMKGTISCKSKLGEGSEFIVAFKRLNNQSFQT